MSDIVSLNGYKIKDEKAVRSYDTIALMKADTKLKEGYHVKTKGYYEANDGGHGEYVIIDDDTLVDDGGTIHVLSNGLRAKLIIGNEITPELFGAYGDGVHDDTNAISNCTKFNKIKLTKQYLTNNIEFTFTNSEIYGNGKIINGVLKLSNCKLSDITLKDCYRNAITLPSTVNENKCIFDNIKIDTTYIPNNANYMNNGYGINIASPNFKVTVKNCYFTKISGIGAVYVQNDGYLDVDSCEFYDIGSRAVHIRENNVDGFFRNSKANYLGVNYVSSERESVGCGIYGHSTGNFKVLNNDIQNSVANCIEGRFTEIANNYCAHTFVNEDYPNPTNSYQGIWLDQMNRPSIIHDNIFNDVSYGACIGGNSNFSQGVECYGNISNNLKSGYSTFFVGNTPNKENIFIHDNPNATLEIGNNSFVKSDILPNNTSGNQINFNYIKRGLNHKLYAYPESDYTNIPNLTYDSTNHRYSSTTIKIPTLNSSGSMYLYFKIHTNSSMSYIENGITHNVSASSDGIIEKELIVGNNGTTSITMNGYFKQIEIDFIEY